MIITSTKRHNILTGIVITLLSFFCCTSKAQNGNTQSVTDKKYVRVDIGHGALHCPFLSPKLEAKLKEIKDIENFFIDRRSSYITFELPSTTEITPESLIKTGTDVGYPAADVIVSMDNKPIHTASGSQ